MSAFSEDDKFTNNEQIEYPLETDIVNVKVLNNNTKLLNEKISQTSVDISNNLKNVAQESSPKYIENQVKKLDNITNKVNTIDTNVNEVKNIVRSTPSNASGGSIVGTVDVVYSTSLRTDNNLVVSQSYSYNNSSANSSIFIGNAVFSNDKYAMGCVVPVQCSSGSSSATLRCNVGHITSPLGSSVSIKFQMAGKLVLLKI